MKHYRIWRGCIGVVVVRHGADGAIGVVQSVIVVVEAAKQYRDEHQDGQEKSEGSHS